MSEFYFTHRFVGLDSSLVWNVWYDADTNTAYVDLQDWIYAYSAVPLSAVQTLVGADSIGRAFNGFFFSSTKGFKQIYGPGKALGARGDINKIDRATLTTTTLTHDGRVFSTGTTTTTTSGGLVGKNLTYSNSAVVDGKPIQATPFVNQGVSDEALDEVAPVRVPLKPASEYPDGPFGGRKDEEVRVPLKAPANEPVEVSNDYEFTVHFESNGSKTYTTRANDWHAAVKNLHDAADILGVRVKVTGVFVHLG